MDLITRRYRAILLTLFLVISVFADYFLIGPNNYITLLSPSIGLIMIYHMYYKDHFIFSLLVYAFTLLISRFLLISESVGMSLFVVAYKTFALLCMMVLFDYLLIHLKNNGYKSMNVRDIWNYIFLGVFVSFVGATLNLVPIFVVFEYENNLFWYGNTWIGYMFGFFIFGSSLHYAFIYDTPKINRKEFYLSLLFLLITLIISLLLFSHISDSFNHLHFSYLFFVIYLIGALFLNFRNIFIANYIVFGSYGIFFYSQHDTFDLTTELISIIIILFILTGFSVLVKYVYFKAINKEVESINLKDSLKNMLYETSEILKNIENISTSDRTFSNDFLIKMFRMGTRIIEKFDKASLYIKENGIVRFVDAIGYDINYLNTLNLDEKDFVWIYSEPEIISEEEVIYSGKFTNDSKYVQDYASIDQSVRFTVMYDGQPVAGMSFDILKGSNLKLSNRDLDNFTELSHMINSFYDLVVVQDSNKEFKNDIVISLVRALGLYDSYTGKHSEEVAFLSLEISKILNLSNASTQRIYWSAIVHDIGKIGVSYSTITKEGKLSVEEKEEVKRHAIYGYNILRNVKSLKDVAYRVKHHHERWDGLGYPDGLKGNEIPLCSQVLAVCDAVSAMSRDRIYSCAKSVDSILEELRKERGKQFSQKVCDAMIEYIEKSRLIDYFMQTS